MSGYHHDGALPWERSFSRLLERGILSREPSSRVRQEFVSNAATHDHGGRMTGAELL